MNEILIEFIIKIIHTNNLSHSKFNSAALRSVETIVIPSAVELMPMKLLSSSEREDEAQLVN